MIQHSTANDAALAAMRAEFVGRHKLRDYKLSGRHLMKMVLTSGADKAAADAIRERFTYSYGCFLKWSGPTWDHLEMLGRGGRLLVLVSHPYSPPKSDCPDLELFRRAGLNVVIGGERESWYGYQSHHVRVEHPSFARGHAASAAYRARLHRAAPELLCVANVFALQLSEAIRLCPCTGSVDGTPCIHCLMRRDFDRVAAILDEVEGGTRR